jgi:hypothetical protein
MMTLSSELRRMMMCLVVVYQAAARLGSVARWVMKVIKAVDS